MSSAHRFRTWALDDLAQAQLAHNAWRHDEQERERAHRRRVLTGAAAAVLVIVLGTWWPHMLMAVLVATGLLRGACWLVETVGQARRAWGRR